MKEEKSAAHTRAEGKLAVLVFAVFVIWCPTYLIIVRPWINSSIAGYVSSYPAMLHLIPILGPVVFLAWLMGRNLPPKTR